MTRMYQVDIEVNLSICATDEDEAQRICMEQFQKGEYNMDGVVVRCEEDKYAMEEEDDNAMA